MATVYTGSPTATQSPSVQPALGAFPALSLPADADPANAASVAQAYKALADYVAFVMTNLGGSVWGLGGSDVSITTLVNLSAPAYYHNLTLGSGGILSLNGHPIYVSGTLTFATGYIRSEDPASLAGGDATSGGPGSLGQGRNSLTTGGVLGGADGGNGGAAGDPPVVGAAGGGVVDSLGGTGGAGGRNTSTAGGNAGARTVFDPLLGPDWPAFLRNGGGWGFGRSPGTATGRIVGLTGGAGGGGGAGGSSITADGGGGAGGAGGGVAIIVARQIVADATNNVRCVGGKGGNGRHSPTSGDDGCGGGGGGGGAVLIYTTAHSGASYNGPACCPGGAGGLRGAGGASGADGVAGGVGTVTEHFVTF